MKTAVFSAEKAGRNKCVPRCSGAVRSPVTRESVRRCVLTSGTIMNKVAVHTLTMLTAALLLSLSGQVSAAAPDCSAPERQTSSGTVCGTNLDVAGTPVHAYLGMP